MDTGGTNTQIVPSYEHVYHVCKVCRRRAEVCICVSHSPVRQVHHDIGARKRISRPFEIEHVEALINEAMFLFHERDAEGLMRWLRRNLP